MFNPQVHFQSTTYDADHISRLEYHLFIMKFPSSQILMTSHVGFQGFSLLLLALF